MATYRALPPGNVVGSNIFNIMGVLGISNLVSAEGVAVSEEVFRLDIPVMIAVACLPIFFTGHLIARWEGALFLAYYCAYTASLIISATVTALTRTVATVLLGIVIPLTVVTGVVRHIRNGSNGSV